MEDADDVVPDSVSGGGGYCHDWDFGVFHFEEGEELERWAEVVAPF